MVESPYLDRFVVETEWMHGDGDMHTTECAEFLLHQESNLLEFVKFLQALGTAYPCGRGSGDPYSQAVPAMYYIMCDAYIPTDIIDGGDATFNDYLIFYYDELGNKYNVSLGA